MTVETKTEIEKQATPANPYNSLLEKEAGDFMQTMSDLLIPDTQVFVDESGRRGHLLNIGACLISLALLAFLLVGLIGVLNALGVG